MRGSYGRWRMRSRCDVTQASRSGRWVQSGWNGRSRSSNVGRIMTGVFDVHCRSLSRRRMARHMEASMSRFARFVSVVAGLIMLMSITPSWGQDQTYNPTASDNDGNTAGGSSALLQVQTGSDNTAFGRAALFNNLNPSNNTAVGADRLGRN